MAAESGLSRADCQKALNAFSASLTQALRQGEQVTLLGFGTFRVVERAAHTAINPATQQPVDVPARRTVKFKAAAGLV